MNYNKICSGCNKEKVTVDRNMFDGLCADCTDRALNSETFMEKASKRNKKLKKKCECAE